MLNNSYKQHCCEDSAFALIPLREDLYFPREIRVSFCWEEPPNPKNYRKNKKKLHQCKIYPIFNKDKNRCTSSFILPTQKREQLQGESAFQNCRKIRRSQNGKRYNIAVSNFPKPSEVHTFCRVCKVHFSNYQNHISSLPHKNNLKNSKGTYYIKQLQAQYRDIHFSRNYKTTFAEENEQCEGLGRPQKKQKKEKTGPFREVKVIQKVVNKTKQNAAGEYVEEGGSSNNDQFLARRKIYQQNVEENKQDYVVPVEPWMEISLLQYPWIYQHMVSKGLLRPRFPSLLKLMNFSTGNNLFNK